MALVGAYNKFDSYYWRNEISREHRIQYYEDHQRIKEKMIKNAEELQEKKKQMLIEEDQNRAELQKKFINKLNFLG